MSSGLRFNNGSIHEMCSISSLIGFEYVVTVYIFCFNFTKFVNEWILNWLE